jgi:iron complex transport system substrate-binding protein
LADFIMKRRLILAVFVAGAAIAAVAWLGPRFADQIEAPEKADGPDADRPARIVSMAPSTTETLFALGLGDRVAGVTRYCDHPPAARKIARIGGYVDPSYEAIVSLNPDLVILLTSHREARPELAQMGIRTLTIPHKTIGDIHESIGLIGNACGAEDRAHALLAEFEERTARVRHAVQGLDRPLVLVCIGRDTGSGQLAGMYMAGHEGFYNEIIDLAGGVNACRDEQVPYPQLSAEGVIRLNPEVIVDLVSNMNPAEKSTAEIRKQWNRLRTVTAVRKERVHVIVGNHALRPGPRYVEFLKQLARLLHPGAFAGETPDE